MSYFDIYLKYKDLPFVDIFSALTDYDVESAIESNRQGIKQLLTLISPQAENHLEPMAQKAHVKTLNNFGKTIQLYTPMYLSNYCQNQCAYCGFNSQNDLPRKKLSLKEVEEEAKLISSTGLDHILILTGESPGDSPLSYIKDCIKVLNKYFSSISIEIYALSEDEYAQLIREGIDGLTIYQETYDREIYDRVHKAGPKKDYLFRLDAPERAAEQGIRCINIGALLGLADWRKDIFFTALHAQYLQDKFTEVEMGISIPRLRPHQGHFKVANYINTRNMAQIITALRIFMPRLGIILSTRESSQLRDSLLPLGITRMSAGSSTAVGGRIMGSEDGSNLHQFDISDNRSVDEIKVMLATRGYQPVLKDWMHI